MSPTLGRPKSESPKDTMLRVRLDDAYCQKLEQCAAKLNVSKSDVVRKGIDLVEKSIEKKKGTRSHLPQRSECLIRHQRYCHLVNPLYHSATPLTRE